MSSHEVLAAGIQLFNHDHYWYAHEVWEVIWKALPQEEQHLFQSLIQFAAAMHHAQNQNEYGFSKLLERAAVSLSRVPVTTSFMDTSEIARLIKTTQQARWSDGRPLFPEGAPRLPAGNKGTP